MISALDVWLLGLIDSAWALPVLFVSAVADGLFPPVPSESFVIALAALAVEASDPAKIVVVILIGAMGAWCGDVIAYIIGRSVDITRLRILAGPRSQRTVARTRAALARNSMRIIVTARFIPIGRVAVNLTAGSVGLDRRRFLSAASIAAISWASYTATIGIVAGHWVRGHPMYAVLIGVVLGLAIGSAVDGAARLARRRRRAQVLETDAVDRPIT